MTRIPKEMLEGLNDVPRLLSKRGPLSSFLTLDEGFQKYWLSTVLGDESPLIPEILHLSTVSVVRYSHIPVHELFILILL